MKYCFLFLFSLMVSLYSFAYVQQGNWRWRSDNGTESSATWRAAQNKGIKVSNFNNIRLRLQLTNTTGSEKGINYTLQYATSTDGPWTYITRLTGNRAFVLANNSNSVADGAPTTQQLSGATTAFQPGKVYVKTDDVTEPIANNKNTEYEWCIRPTSYADANTVYYFRVPNADYPGGFPALMTDANLAVKQKLLGNGGFEDNLNQWSTSVTGGAAADFVVVDSSHRYGVKGLLVNVSKKATAKSILLSHTPIATGSNHTYMLRFWAKAKKDGALMTLALKGKELKTYDFKLYTGWSLYEYAFKTKESALATYFTFNTATQYFIDDVEVLDETDPVTDVEMNYMWQNKRNPSDYSWLSADGENSEPLPDGRTVWTFSDGWYGFNDTTTNSMSTNRLLRNTLVVQSAPKPNGNLTTLIGGTVAQPQAIMIPPDARGHDNFFWPRDMIVENDSLKVLLPEVIQWNPNDPLTDGHREAVGVFSLPDLQLASIKWMPWIDSTNYIALCKADDGFTYAYGARPINQFESYAIVARYPSGQLSATTPWQFLTDTGWSYHERNNSKAIADVNLYSVTRLGRNNYMALYMNPLSDKVEVEFAQSPIGPWVGRSIVGQLEGQADILSYFGLLHEETANDGVYTFSYSNIGDIGRMLNDKTVYWPSYLKADLKSLSPFNDVVLPITRLSFDAQPQGRQVQLTWHTTEGTANNHFLIEKSTNGRENWTTVAVVKAKNNSGANRYELLDKAPFAGANYYRLQQHDKTGKITYSDIKLVSLAQASAVVYPNPAHGAVHLIIHSAESDKITATLTDIKGTLLHKEVIAVSASATNYTLHFGKQPPAGVYLLQLQGSTISSTAKVVIE